jgi:hypothetical protein
MNIKILHENVPSVVDSTLDEREQARSCIKESFSGQTTTVRCVSDLFIKSNKCLKRANSDSDGENASNEWTSTFVKIVILIFFFILLNGKQLKAKFILRSYKFS